jgi:periplasmic mercuric ion binding protein
MISCVILFIFLITFCLILIFKIMKTLKYVIGVLLIVALGSHLNAQKMINSKTETIKVSGNCDLCKVRIEKAAKIQGVSNADWNKDTKLLTLIYDPSKVKSDDVQKKIASIGHDTEKYKAEDKAYNSLPVCCQYR